MMHNLNESTIEHHAIALFQELGYAYAFGPDVGPDGNVMRNWASAKRKRPFMMPWRPTIPPCRPWATMP